MFTAFLRFKHLNPMYIYQDKTEIDFILNNQLLVETKYHDKNIPAKQDYLLKSFKNKEFMIVRNEKDISEAISKAK